MKMKKENKSLKKEDKPVKKEFGLRDVISILLIIFFAIFSFFSGVVTIQAGQFVVGFLFIFLAAFLFVPKKYLRITGVLKGAIFIVIYFALLLISGMNAPIPEQQYEYYSLEQPFNLTSNGALFSIVIKNTTIDTKLLVDGKEITTSGLYLFVNGMLTNGEKVPAEFNLRSELKDDKDNLYNLLAINMGVGSFQPNLERHFYHVFEIPKNASGLKFFIKDKSKVIKIVDLGR
jgi:hypothetical protein